MSFVHTAIQLVKICFGISVSSGNFLVFYTLGKCQSLNVATRYLLANLRLGDAFLGLAIGVHAVTQLIGVYPQCSLLPIMVGSISLSGSSVLLLSLQSFLYIAFPIRFKKGIRTGVVVGGVALIWILVIAQGVLVYVNADKERCIIMNRKNNMTWMKVQSLFLLMYCLAMVFLQVSSLVLLKYQDCRLHRRVHGAPTTTINESARKLQHLKRSGRIVAMITSVLVLFLVSWLPFTVTWVVYSFCGEACTPLEYPPVMVLASVGQIISSIGNIITYWKRSEEFRTILSARLRCGHRVGVLEAESNDRDIELRETA